MNTQDEATFLLLNAEHSLEKRKPINLTWQDLKYTITTKNRKEGKVTRVILNNVSGFARPGEILAVMGSTGAGKSTLLDILAGRKKSGNLFGQVLVNGEPPNRLYKRIASYVTQDDCLMGTQTIKETFDFYSRLKLPNSTPSIRRRARVDEVISELSLGKVADSYIGTQFRRGISGGEKKRVSIGTELITDPGLLFLDEPTTGLDSYNSLGVMEQISKLAKTGRTIVCTIHQPRSTIFELFDRLMILSNGWVVYFGSSKDAIDYFGALYLRIKPQVNPADFLLDVVIMSEGSNSDLEGSELLGMTSDSVAKANETDLIKSYEDSALYRENLEIIKELNSAQKTFTGDLRGESTYAAPWYIQVFHILKRNFVNISRIPTATYVQLFQTIFMSLLIGSIFLRLGFEQRNIQDRTGVLFFMVTNTAFNFAALHLFLEERNLFNRERTNGMYCTSAYFVARNIADTMVGLVFPFVFACISYWMVGLQSDPIKFGIFVLTLLVFSATCTSLFLAIGAASPSAIVASILSPIFLVLLLLFGGFYVTNDSVPVYYIWIHYISPIRYAYEILMNNEFIGLDFTCKNVTNCSLCVSNGESQLHYMSMDGVDIWRNMAIMAAEIVVLRFLAYLFLRFLYKDRS
eukprot:TRINITY_DN11859_c0_g1_i2.p1 TRINITY_DN11859_c0_g1~~TRINITY_DN11859_c0_g1_i2.p1  ORF type:complete len:633 (+),score=88.25 TRINITY_DN11859_c0_g1_i2:70-1968(+)